MKYYFSSSKKAKVIGIGAAFAMFGLSQVSFALSSGLKINSAKDDAAGFSCYTDGLQKDEKGNYTFPEEVTFTYTITDETGNVTNHVYEGRKISITGR